MAGLWGSATLARPKRAILPSSIRAPGHFERLVTGQGGCAPPGAGMPACSRPALQRGRSSSSLPLFSRSLGCSVTKPDWCPQDVWEKAVKCAETVLSNLPEDYGDVTLEVAMIAHAILAERERCATNIERRDGIIPDRSAISREIRLGIVIDERGEPRLPGWHPITSVPRDGTVVDLTLMDGGKLQEIWQMRWSAIQRNGSFPGVTGMWVAPFEGGPTWNDDDPDGGPTHWRYPVQRNTHSPGSPALPSAPAR